MTLARLRPRHLNRQITVEPYAGRGGDGPLYGASYVLDCRLRRERRLVRTDQGDEFVSATVVLLTPDTVPPPQGSRISIDGSPVGVVGEVGTVDGRRKAAYREVVLR